MPHVTNYRIAFKDVDGNDVTIDIEDRASAEGTPAYTNLTGAGDVLSISRQSTAQDPFHPVLATAARIRFLSTSTYMADTFSSGTDNRFFVHAYTATETIFLGFLVMDDNEMPLVNPAFSQTVVLMATDNIGTLKDVELINTTTGLPLTDGQYTLLQYIQFCLNRTGLALNLNIAWNLFEEDFISTTTPLHQAGIHSLTFEKELTTKEDCYTVLQKIVSSLKARLFQFGGEWYLVRLHEYRTALNTLTFIRYDSEGTELATFAPVAVASTIASTEPLFLIGADATKVTVRSHKFDKDRYAFEFPREIIPNIDFTRGDLIGGTNPKTFQIANWTLEKYGGGAPNVSAYIQRSYDANGGENERYVVIEGGANEHWIKSEAIPLHQNDKFNFSVDQRFSDNLTGSSGNYTFHVAMLRLIGDDGTYWNLNGNPNFGKIEWVQSNAAFTTNIRYLSRTWDITRENEEYDWWTVDVEAPPLPVTGELFVLLRKSDFNNSYNTHFSNLQFDYIPYINGTYAKYNAQYNKVTQADAYKAKREEDLAISNGPKKLFKGALKKFNFVTGKWVLVENWLDSFDSGASGSTTISKILVYDVWNQYKGERSVITGAVKGPMAGYSFLRNKFTFSEYSATKRFICLNEDINVKRRQMRGSFIEVFDTGDSNDYTTPHEFKYEQ